MKIFLPNQIITVVIIVSNDKIMVMKRKRIIMIIIIVVVVSIIIIKIVDGHIRTAYDTATQSEYTKNLISYTGGNLPFCLLFHCQ